MVRMLHTKITQLVLGFANGTMGPESVLQFLQEHWKIVIPSRNGIRVRVKHLRFKPVESGTAKEGHHVNDFVVVGNEIVLALSEMKVTLSKERSELLRVRSIKGIRVPKI